jgi:hypothetical protein
MPNARSSGGILDERRASRRFDPVALTEIMMIRSPVLPLALAGLLALAGRVSAAALPLAQGSSCSPTWVPTFGPGADGPVHSLLVHDDGSGPALYAGGASGPALYAGGSFTSAGGLAADRVAKWDGTSWTALGSGLSGGDVHTLAVHDDGQGPELQAGGTFTAAGGIAASRVARWDGAGWAPLGSGMTDGFVLALASGDLGDGSALFAGGSFTSAPDSGDGRLARWTRDSTAPTLACWPVFAVDRLGSAPGEVVHFAVAVDDDSDPAPNVVCVPPSGSFFPRGTTMVTCTAMDECGNESTCQFSVTVLPKVRRR